MEKNLFRSLKTSIRSNAHISFLFLIPISNLLFTPIQSRLIAPDLLGAYQTYISIISIAIIFTTCKVETLILQSPKVSEQKHFGSIASRISLINSIILSICICFLWKYFFNGDNFVFWSMFFITPVILYVFSIDNIGRVFMVRNSYAADYYKLSFIRNLFKNLMLVAIPLFSSINLLILLLVESVFRLIGIAKQFKSFKITVPKINLYYFLWGVRNTTLYYAFSLLVNTLTASLPLFFIQSIDSNIGGQYAMLIRLFGLPSMLLASFVSDRISAIHHAGNSFLKKLIISFTVVSILFSLLMYVLPSSFYVFFLGSKWDSLSLLARKMSISISLEMLFSGLSVMIILHNSMRIKYSFDFLYLFATAVPFLFNDLVISEKLHLLNLLRSLIALIFIIIIFKKYILRSHVWNSRRIFG